MRRDEKPMTYLRRLVKAMDYERESILDALPNIHAVIDYFKLWDTYDTEYLEGIAEMIADGADPEPMRKFIKKYKLPWTMERWRR